MVKKPKVDVDELATVYVRIRDALRAKEEEHKKDVAGLREKLACIDEEFLSLCNELNVDSLKTSAGTITRRVSNRYWVSDWEALYVFIAENSAPFLLEKRIHNGNMKQFLEENPDASPVGLQTNQEYKIQVRKPTS